MKCPGCGHENREQARFCEECGTSFRQSCAQCGASLGAGAKFCDQCGAPTSADDGRADAASGRSLRDYTPKHLADKILTSRSALEGERKRVTVFFADMKGSQELAEEVDPEEWHGILDRFFGILTSGIHRYEGTVNQYTGDGIMALFGAPIAHEDHAARACHAALIIMGELRRFADELRLTRGLNLSMRIGLNTGEVVVGRIGDDLRMDYTAQGHTVGLAARMEQIAEPGRVYLTRNTASLVEGYFKLRDLGEMKVKGSRTPIRVYELEGIGELQTRLDVSRSRGLSRFIGRERELAQLKGALDRIAGGKGEVAAVIGNAGIGKSRLSFEISEEARRRGVSLLRSTCVPYASAVPYFPLLGLLRSYFGIGERDAAAEIRRKVAGTLLMADENSRELLPLVFEFLGVPESGAPDSAIPPEARQSKLFDLFLKLFAGRGQAGVILMEDLHWLDAGSEAFLERLAGALRDTPTLLLLNYRPDYVGDGLQKQLDLELALSALGETELEQLTRELLGPALNLVPVAKVIRERAGGNPYFVEEAVQSLVESGHLAGSQGAYRLMKPVEEFVIPETVQAILAARVDRLTDRDKHVLQAAAVVGREFDEPLLARVAGLSGTELEESLTLLEEGGYVSRKDMQDLSHYNFCHPLVQEVAYRSQLGERRARIHAGLAQAMEEEMQGKPPLSDKAVMLAYHWDKAGNALKAGQWYIPAAIWSAMRNMDASVTYYRRAIEVLDMAPDAPELIRLKISARAGLMRISGLMPVPNEEIERVYQEAREMSERAQNKQAIAELLISYGSRQLNQAHADAAVELTSQAMRIAHEIGDRDLQSRLRLNILLAYFNSGRLQEGLDEVEASSDGSWSRAEITEENVASRGFRAVMLACMGRLHEARSELERAVAVLTSLNRSASWTHANLVEIAYYSGIRDQAMHEAKKAISIAEESTSSFFLELAYRALAQAHVLNGQWQEAIAVLEKTMPMIDKDQVGYQFTSGHLSMLAEAWLGAGSAQKALDLVTRALDFAIASQMRIWELRSRLISCRALRAVKGAAAAAEIKAHLAALDTLIAETGATTFQPLVTCERAELAAIDGDTAAQNRLYSDALVQFRGIGADGHAATLDRRLNAERAKLG